MMKLMYIGVLGVGVGIDTSCVGAFVPNASNNLRIQQFSSSLASSTNSNTNSNENSEQITPTESNSFSTNDFEEQLSKLDPSCAIDDEDCLAFARLDSATSDGSTLAFNTNSEECDYDDVDCQSLLSLNADTYLSNSLKSRSVSLQKELTHRNWKVAHCPTTFVSVSNSDWVRRVHMDTYPIVACGSARGGVYVVNLEEGEVIGKAESVHPVQVEDVFHQGQNSKVNTGAEVAKQCMEKMFGKLDGGGVIAIAIRGDIVVSSGREGGVRLWRIGQLEDCLKRCTSDARAVDESRSENNEVGSDIKTLGEEEDSGWGRNSTFYGWEELSSLGKLLAGSKSIGKGSSKDGANDTKSKASDSKSKSKLSQLIGQSKDKSTKSDNEVSLTRKSTSQKMGSNLIPLGSISSLQNTIVTSLKFDSNDLLWTSCYDGTVRAYNISAYQSTDDKTTTISKVTSFPPQKPVFETDFTDSVLDMHLCEDLNIGVAATIDGSCSVFSMIDGQFFVGIMLFEGLAARSVLVMKDTEEEVTIEMSGKKQRIPPRYSVVCGGMDGVIHRIPLNIDQKTGKVDEDNPFDVTESTETAMKPKHTGPVLCLASPNAGMFITGGQDGSIRVWECPEEDNKSETRRQRHPSSQQLPKCIYALSGYKIWLSNISTDGSRIVSDGGENNLIVRDFSWKSDGDGKVSL